MNIVVLGAGMQGTLYAVRLAQAGHAVTLVARGKRAAELRERGAVIEHAVSGRRDTEHLPVLEELPADMRADLCLVVVRREQLDDVVPVLAAARAIGRFVVMVNHANGSTALFTALGRARVVLGFPGAAGGLEGGVDRYLDVAEQPTVIESVALDVARLLRGARFKVELVEDMDSWLRRHAVFVTAICGALYETDCNASRLSINKEKLRALIFAIREGWAALDGRGVAPAPLALRAIFLWVPIRLSVSYWSRLLASPRGENYFGRHARHAAREMSAVAADLRALVPADAMPHLKRLHDAIDRATQSSA